MELGDVMLDVYNYDLVECIRRAADIALAYGWLILAFCCLYVFKLWLFHEKE